MDIIRQTLLVSLGAVALLSGFTALFRRRRRRQAAGIRTEDSLGEDPAVAFGDAPWFSGLNPETIAAITAAIACVWNGPSGFVVKRVRRIYRRGQARG